MHEALIALVIFLCLIAASLGCLYCHERLPPHHRQDDTQAVIRLVATLFVVMTSLVLGLMLNSAKNRFEAIDRDVHAFATNLILLDRMLREYGPETAEAHQRLLDYLRRTSHGASTGRWVGDDDLLADDRASERVLMEVGSRLRTMQPADAEHVVLRNEARQQFRSVVALRWGLVERAEGSIPTPLVGMVAAWLIMIFASFGYRAPRNLTIIATFIASAALVAGALYLILDMDAPFTGPIQVSSAPLQRTLAEMQQ